MSDEQQEKYQEILTRYQKISIQHVTNTANILLTITIGVIAFAVNVLVNSQTRMAGMARVLFEASLVLLFFSSFAGIALMFVRLEYFRRLATGARIARDLPAGVTQEAARSLKTTANALNTATQILIYAQPLLFIVGFLSLALSVYIVNRFKLA